MKVEGVFFLFLLCLVQAGVPVGVSRQMKCGECIFYGYNSCQKGQDHQLVTSSSYNSNDGNQNQCYSQSETSKYSDSNWICTNHYNNTLFSTYACPQNVDVCGQSPKGMESDHEYILSEVDSTLQLNVTGMEKGDTCFYRVKTQCGVLETTVNYTRAQTRGNGRDYLMVNFIEFSSNTVMTGDGYSDPNLGGAPAQHMPMRSETFWYEEDEKIADVERLVASGRINLGDQATSPSNVTPHYWGSYEQGKKKPMVIDTLSCRPRYTYLIVRSVSEHKYDLSLNLKSTQIETFVPDGAGLFNF